MSESNKDKEKKEGEGQQSQGREVTIKVDRTEEMKDLQTQIEKIEAEARKKDEEKKALETELAKEKEEKKTVSEEKDSLKSQLETIAEKEWAKKKTEVKDRTVKLFPNDENRVKDIMSKLEDPEKGPENLGMTEYMLNTIEDAINKGKEEERKVKEAEVLKAKVEAEAKAKGTPPASGPALTGAQTGDNKEQVGYESEVAMIRDLRRKARDPTDPVKQAEAEAILNELFLKWAKATKSDYDTLKVDLSQEDKKTIRQTKKEGA
jgi:hypothetical protein